MPSSATADEVVATVAGRAITLDDVQRRIATIRRGSVRDHLPGEGTPEWRRFQRWVVRLVVTEAVVRHEARQAGIPASTPPRQAATRLFEQLSAGVAVDEAQVAAYYSSNQDLYHRPESRRVRHVLLEDRARAEQVADRARRGQDLADLARLQSRDRGSCRRGGDLGELRRGELVGPFEDAAFTAEPGELVGPVKTEFGWHVLRVEAVTPPGRVPYQDARAAIEADLVAAARGRAFDAWLEQRRAAIAAMQPGWWHPGDPRLPDSVHRH